MSAKMLINATFIVLMMPGMALAQSQECTELRSQISGQASQVESNRDAVNSFDYDRQKDQLEDNRTYNIHQCQHFDIPLECEESVELTFYDDMQRLDSEKDFLQSQLSESEGTLAILNDRYIALGCY